VRPYDPGRPHQPDMFFKIGQSGNPWARAARQKLRLSGMFLVPVDQLTETEGAIRAAWTKLGFLKAGQVNEVFLVGGPGSAQRKRALEVAVAVVQGVGAAAGCEVFEVYFDGALVPGAQCRAAHAPGWG
jgi:hypothetical protein